MPAAKFRAGLIDPEADADESMATTVTDPVPVFESVDAHGVTVVARLLACKMV
jgi:hypothetical protein